MAKKKSETKQPEEKPVVVEMDLRTQTAQVLERALYLAESLGDERAKEVVDELATKLAAEKLGEEELQSLATEADLVLREVRARQTEAVTDVREMPAEELVAAGNDDEDIRRSAEESVQRAADQTAALELLRKLDPGESLVDAVERLEALAAKGRLLAALDGGTRVSGVIVQDVEGEKHRVYLLESRADGSLAMWEPDEKKEALPWHAANPLVQRLMETRLTPEQKR